MREEEWRATSLLPITDDWETPASIIPEQKSKSGKYEIKHRIIERGTTLEMSERALGKRSVYALEDFEVVTLIERIKEEDLSKPEYDHINDDLLFEDKEDENYVYLVWMSDTPKEYYEMCSLMNRIPVRFNLSGKMINQNIIIGGLGLGILPNLLSLRNDIRKILVIELEEEIIEMVKPYLFKKIQVINEDFFKFIERVGKDKMQLGKYFPIKKYKNKDYPPKIDVFIADIWSQSELSSASYDLFIKSLELLIKYFEYSLHLFWDYEDNYDSFYMKHWREKFP